MRVLCIVCAIIKLRVNARAGLVVFRWARDSAKAKVWVRVRAKVRARFL